jgi:hypothetical protein
MRIEYWEELQESAAPLLSDGSGVRISANRGEYVISSRHPTEAWQFLCSEQLNILFRVVGEKSPLRSLTGKKRMKGANLCNLITSTIMRISLLS